MSYHVDVRTQLFDSLTDKEALDLELIIEDMILQGKTYMDHPAFIAWTQALQYDERQALLVHSVAFPQRALLSVLHTAHIGCYLR